MRITISIIVIAILIIFLIILLHSSYATSESFISANAIDEIKNYKGKVSDTYDTIENPISDSLIPNNPKMKVELSEYEVIELFKSILERPPSIQEIKKYSYFTSTNLKEYLYNSPEYDKLIKTQDNHVNNGIEGAIARKNILNRIITIYSTIYKNELSTKMMLPLRDCFIYLQLNDYLFTAMLESYNYKKFEIDVLTTYVLTKKILLQLFNKHFNALELKLIAQEKINKENIAFIKIDTDIEDIKTELLKVSNIAGATNVSEYIKNTFPNVFNKLIDKSTLPIEAPTLPQITVTKEKYENKINFEIKDNKIKNSPNKKEVYVRIYDPIKHNRTYSNDNKERVPICTSLGQKQLVQPVFTESKMLFNGTDINKAFEDTQVGSIMPKFEYREYNEVKVN